MDTLSRHPQTADQAASRPGKAGRAARSFRPRGEPALSLPPSPPAKRKGRGAVTNPTGRFEKTRREPFDDGWSEADDADFAPPVLRTTVTPDSSRTVIARNQSPDIGFDRSINPYRGCEHGCVYCFARPTHAYLGLSPGLDFETRLFAKPDAAELLKGELSNPSYACRPIAMGTNTDPYQPIERTRGITRSILEVLAACDHPVTIVTKGALVARDIDILAPMAARNLVKVALSVTTLDRGLARRMEPRAATPAKRLATITALSEAGIPTGVMVAPVVPALTDHELEEILAAARDAGAGTASYIPLRLPHEVKDLFAEWLGEHAPLKAEHVLNRVRDMRDGRLNDPDYGTRMRGSGPFADLLHKRFVVATHRLGLARRDAPLNTEAFRPPYRRAEQLSLL